jgi:hypothetical protein
MSGRGPKPLSELLQSGDIGRLAEQARARNTLTEQVKSMLSASEAEHLIGARRAADGQLVIAMDSAAWAARVRYRAKELWRDKVRVKVVPRGERSVG